MANEAGVRAAISESTILRPATELIMRKVGDEAILVPVRNRVGDLNSVYTLNEVAISVWQRLDGRMTVAQIVQEICTEYDVDEGTARSDVTTLLDDLVEASLVTAVHPGHS